jgi:hypothetical protein
MPTMILIKFASDRKLKERLHKLSLAVGLAN